jgi:hypothetical protein
MYRLRRRQEENENDSPIYLTIDKANEDKE